MNKRITELRKSLNLSMEVFGAKLGVTRSTISRVEAGAVNVTNQMFTAICREYNVNEEWLKTGNGNMFNDLTREEQAAHIVGNAINSDNDFVIKTFIALGQLTPNEWQVVEKLVKSISEK